MASCVALYLRSLNQGAPHIELMELLLRRSYWAPFLRNHSFGDVYRLSFAQTTGKVVAVVLTAFLFALFHQPADLAHWVSLTATGLAYGWIRVASDSTAAATIMETNDNLALSLSTTF